MNLAKTALLVIDLQNEYRPGAAWPVVSYDTVLANTAALIEAARKAACQSSMHRPG
ncbi:Isochorismatase hydrolase (fragment) [Mesorhizobium sp. SOD10]